jgi:hypothetical protein
MFRPERSHPPKSARIYRIADDVLPTLDVEPKRIGRADSSACTTRGLL